ncbi:MAG: hypothetical protein ASARMPRED_005466 [Alectoria sarmentosa]|nr:MAG: hypothetical protein ASARMPRED_005466 [Alectoria sarmentosa]
MDGPSNNNTRSDWYDIVHPRVSPIFSRDEKSHTDRRRTDNIPLRQAIKEYLPRILRQISTLEQLIATYGSQPVVVNDIMQWFAFDSMGEFAFNESYNMMKSGKQHSAITQQRSALALLGPLNAAIWIPRLAFADSQMKKRLQTKVEEPDIAAWFIKDLGNDRVSMDKKTRQNLLSGNTATAIVAGSYPEHAEKIYGELSSIDTHDLGALAALPHFNGVINESMRLFPAALTTGSRLTPPEGLHIDGTFIPGATKITAPRYSVFRHESAFEDPHSFIPERWYSRPELIKDQRAFAPFGVGRRICVGKNLALTQIRLVTATLVCKYRVRFASGDKGEAMERDLRDQLTALPGRFSVVFDVR